MREAAYMIDADEIYVVPDFISEGYFTQEVIPRELRLTGPTTRIDGRAWHYCLPVGIHPSMTGLILRRAAEVASGVDPSTATLIITGHGTGLNQNSTKAIRDQVDLIAASGAGYAKVTDAYMEEAPFIAEWDKLADTPNVIVVPFFIADGLHSYQDIPVLLGIEPEVGPAASQREVFRHNPHHLRGKTLYYSSAIGTEPHIADVILDQVRDFDLAHKPSSPETIQRDLASDLARLIRGGVHRIGEVEIITGLLGSAYVLCHHHDAESVRSENLSSLEIHQGPDHAREVGTWSADSEYRFAKGQVNLKRGWVMLLTSDEELRLAIDHLYPASAGLEIARRGGHLEVENLRDKLNRQTGMYRFARNVSNEGAQSLITEVCGPAHQCARRILWQLDSSTPLADSEASRYNGIPGGLSESAAIPLLCREACNHFVAECRKLAKAEYEARAAAPE